MSFFKSTGRRPGIETLEAKQLLAVYVLVGVDPGPLAWLHADTPTRSRTQNK